MVLGDDMLDLVTDKATITIPAPCAGTLIEQLAAAGAKITGADRLLILQPDQ
jgi:pyruvate/2-oxoglutarate dehydrogenase complex dihydrolipoamide acyltransferase (E2) component